MLHLQKSREEFLIKVHAYSLCSISQPVKVLPNLAYINIWYRVSEVGVKYISGMKSEPSLPEPKTYEYASHQLIPVQIILKTDLF